MLVNKAVQFAVLTAAVLLEHRTEAGTSTAVKFCGRQLSEIMSKICQAYNSPTWDVPTVVEQPGALARRRRRHVGIADQCCQIGCTWDQFSEYCSISAYTEPPLDTMAAHIIEGRSAERVSERARARQEPVTSTTSAPRAAPFVGTVSPLITWGRILSTDVLTPDREHYAYVVSNK